jgi:pyrroline-5-carboxylate reductase
MYKIGFIGCGNMGGALITAAAKTVNGADIAVCDQDQAKLEKYTAYGAVALSAEALVQQSKFVVLGVKPQVMESALAPLKNAFQAREDVTVITMAAGLSINAIRSFVGKDLPVIRIMPNTPVTLGEGMILYATDGVSEETEADFLTAFSKAGIFDKIPEEAIDAGSALSGCGPAFAYLFIEAMAAGGVEKGLSREQSLQLAAQTVLGATQMVLQTGRDPIALKDAVCSPGGATLQGVAVLERDDLKGVVTAAIDAAYKRTLELKG